jgi:hypothetical protein
MTYDNDVGENGLGAEKGTALGVKNAIDARDLVSACTDL